MRLISIILTLCTSYFLAESFPAHEQLHLVQQGHHDIIYIPDYMLESAYHQEVQPRRQILIQQDDFDHDHSIHHQESSQPRKLCLQHLQQEQPQKQIILRHQQPRQQPEQQHVLLNPNHAIFMSTYDEFGNLKTYKISQSNPLLMQSLIEHQKMQNNEKEQIESLSVNEDEKLRIQENITDKEMEEVKENEKTEDEENNEKEVTAETEQEMKEIIEKENKQNNVNEKDVKDKEETKDLLPTVETEEEMKEKNEQEKKEHELENKNENNNGDNIESTEETKKDMKDKAIEEQKKEVEIVNDDEKDIESSEELNTESKTLHGIVENIDGAEIVILEPTEEQNDMMFKENQTLENFNDDLDTAQTKRNEKNVDELSILKGEHVIEKRNVEGEDVSEEDENVPENHQELVNKSEIEIETESDSQTDESPITMKADEAVETKSDEEDEAKSNDKLKENIAKIENSFESLEIEKPISDEEIKDEGERREPKYNNEKENREEIEEDEEERTDKKYTNIQKIPKNVKSEVLQETEKALEAPSGIYAHETRIENSASEEDNVELITPTPTQSTFLEETADQKDSDEHEKQNEEESIENHSNATENTETDSSEVSYDLSNESNLTPVQNVTPVPELEKVIPTPDLDISTSTPLPVLRSSQGVHKDEEEQEFEEEE